MKLSTPTKDQLKKVLKASVYAFVSSFVATLLIVPDVSQIDQRAVVSAVVAGVNSVLVLVKQFFTEG